MNNFSKRAVSSLVLLIITLSVMLSSLTSCNLFAYVAESEEEIRQNIQQSLSDDGSENEYVADYLRDWGLPKFDKVKFIYMETCFIQVYNYEEGLPDTLAHAAETAELFIEYFYNDIDRSNKKTVTDSLLYCYVDVIDDPYSIYRPPTESADYATDMSGKFVGIGVGVEYNDADESIMINTVYPSSPAEEAGVKVGDYIYAIDGKTLTELGYTNAVNYIRGEKGTQVELTLIRGGEKVTVNVTRDEIEEINVDYSIDESTGIGYVRIVSFKKNTFDQFVNAIDALEAANVKGIVFDVRGNPGGYVDSVCDVISYIIPTGHTVLSYQYKGRPATELKSTDDAKNTDHVIDLPITVICNEYTASAGEIFTAAIRDYRDEGLLRASIVGTNTFGKGIMQNTYYYLDDSSVTLTVAYYNPPCGENYHGKGVAPDVVIENTAEEDLQLLTAYAELLELINAN